MIFRELQSIKMCWTINSIRHSEWMCWSGMTYSKTINNNLIFPIVYPEQYVWSISCKVACNLLPTSLSYHSCHKNEIDGLFVVNEKNICTIGDIEIENDDA